MLLVETYLSESPGMGLGLFSAQLIKKDSVIWEFVDGIDIKIHISKYDTLKDLQKKFVDTYFWREGDYLYSSCDHSIFQNHSKYPNSICHGNDKMIAARDILPNEEITVSYGDFDDDFDSYKNDLK